MRSERKVRLLDAIAFALLLSSCKQERAPAMSDAEIKEVRLELPGMTDKCLETMRQNGAEALPRDYDQCFKFTAPARMQGLWRNDFESSVFCEASAADCRYPVAQLTSGDFVWLKLAPPPAGYDDTPPGGLYAIDFIGRRSVGKGQFGYGAGSEVVVDRLLSIKLVEPPPPGGMTKEGVKRYLKDCGSKLLCMPNSEASDSR